MSHFLRCGVQSYLPGHLIFNANSGLLSGSEIVGERENSPSFACWSESYLSFPSTDPKPENGIDNIYRGQ